MKGRKKEIEKMGDIELNNKIESLKESIFLFNLELSLGNSPKNTNLIKNSKKEIARILTHKRKKELI